MKESIWVARDANEKIYIFDTEPIKDTNGIWTNDDDGHSWEVDEYFLETFIFGDTPLPKWDFHKWSQKAIKINLCKE